MRLTLIAVGRLRPPLQVVFDDYLVRLGRWAEVRQVAVREAARAGRPPVQRREEARAIRAAIPDGAHWVLLDVAGRPWSSEVLAQRVSAWRNRGRPVVVVVGGPHGVEPRLAADANERWSLGPLTLPHELARVVVAEQLYRAFTILHGLPYHKGADDRR